MHKRVRAVGDNSNNINVRTLLCKNNKYLQVLKIEKIKTYTTMHELSF